MKTYIYTNISILGLLIIAKLSSSFSNMSPFIATIIVGSYFIKNKYHLMLMIFIAQLLSDLYYGVHLSNLFIYISYTFIVIFLYIQQKNMNFYVSFINTIYANFIFFSISNLGHYIAYNNNYSLGLLLENYLHGLPFAFNLMVSTIIFISIYHFLLAVSMRQLVKNILRRY